MVLSLKTDSSPRSTLARKAAQQNIPNLKTLTEDLSRQDRHPMVGVSVDVAQCHGRVNPMIVTLVWYARIGKLGPIVVLLTCLQTMRHFQCTGFGDSIIFLDGRQLSEYLMGLRQGSRVARPSWIQLSSVVVNTLQRLDCGAMIVDPITRNVIM